MSSAVCQGVTRSECRTVCIINVLEVFPLHLQLIAPPGAASGAACAALPITSLCDMLGGVLNYPPRFRFIHFTTTGNLIVEVEPEITGDVIKAKLETVRRALSGSNERTNET